MIYDSGFKWGERSKKVLDELQPELRVVMGDALRLSSVDFSLVDGARTIEEQRKYFKEGKSKVNPDAYPSPDALYAAAKHVVGPGMPKARAVDIIIGVEGKGYDMNHLSHVAGVILTCARQRGIAMRWGGNFDQDGQILEQPFIDSPHFELL